jgi:hypothetical protein
LEGYDLEQLEALLTEEIVLVDHYGTPREQASIVFEVERYLAEREGHEVNRYAWYILNGFPLTWAEHHRVNLFRWRERKEKLGL